MRRLAQVLTVVWLAASTLSSRAGAQPVAPPPAAPTSSPASPAPAGTPSPASPTPSAPRAPLGAAVEVDAPEHALIQKIAVWRFDALGIEPALVAQLEALFRSELDRLAQTPLPSRREIERKISEPLSNCTGEAKCLAAIGKRLGVEVMVAGSVGSLGDNYLLDIKVVDVATAKQLRRITTDPLRGTPDELIDSVRVAAYRLLAPGQLHGSIAILSDLIGGEVSINGKRVGQTPLPAPISKLALGPHTVRVSARGYVPFEEKVEVRFQKSARVEVRLVVDLSAGAPPPLSAKPAPRSWYSRPWVLVAVGAAAVVTGAFIGQKLGEVERRCANC